MVGYGGWPDVLRLHGVTLVYHVHSVAESQRFQLQSSRTPSDVLSDAIADTADSIDGDGAICTGWVMVAEWMTADGAPCMTRLDSALPRWQTVGLLRSALTAYEHEMTRGE